MGGDPPRPSVVCFGDVELDLTCGEVHKAGRRIRLAPQPFKILALLVKRADQLVTREEIQREVWGNETFVDYEKGLNFCIKQIRSALGDDAETPRFIETLPRRGYRFIAAVDYASHVSASSAAPASSVSPPQFDPSAPPAVASSDSPGVLTGHAMAPAAPASGEGGVAARRAGARRRSWALAVAGAAALSAIALGIGLRLARHPGLSFQQRDWVLVASFENRTGEGVFDGTLEYALERELCNSKFVNVVPPERINDTLLLMKKAANTPLDVALGREVCLRDGGIRALLTGRVEKLDTTYLLSVAAVNPTNGVTVASLSEEAAGQRQVPTALRRLSNRLREKLGEEIPHIARSDQALEKATTPSLRALQLYSHGMALVNELKWEQAAALLDQAVKEDPQFASAHIYLAHCYSNVGREDRAAPHYRRAFELADTTTDRERYFILGSYYGRFMPDAEKEVRSYEVLVRLYPDHYWGVNNLVGAYQGMGLPKQAVPYSVRSAEMRPNSFLANSKAAYYLFHDGDNPALARPYALRARALLTPETLQAQPYMGGWVLLFPATECWRRGDVQEAENELTQVAQVVNSLSTKARDSYMESLGFSYIALGKSKSADELFQSLSDPDERNFSLALLALAQDDPATLRRYSRRLGGGGVLLDTSLPPVFMARAGLLSEAQEAIAKRERLKGWTADPEIGGFVKVMKGELALAQGQRSKAIRLLQEGLQEIGPSETFAFFLGVEALARAWEREGNLPEAIETLEKAPERPRVRILHGFAWMRVQWRLAQHCRKVGRQQDAQRIEAELRGLLANADTDFPMLVQLQRLQAVAATPTLK